jgi:hypothetical protein
MLAPVFLMSEYRVLGRGQVKKNSHQAAVSLGQHL